MDDRQFQTPLARDIARLSKKVIVQAMKSLAFPLQPNGTKEKYANDFVRGIHEIIEKKKSISIPIEITLNSICQTVKDHQIVRHLKKNFQNGLQQPVRQSPPNIRKNLNLIENQRDGLRCICDNTHHGQSVQCSDCYKSFHTVCLRIPKNQKFECPLCFAKNMDPLNEVRQVIFCGYMSSENRIHRVHFTFNPTPDQQKYQLQIRSFRLDSKNNYLITWPDYGDLKLNEYKILQLKPLAQNSSLKKRKDQIKVVEKKCLRTNNSLIISEAHSCAREVRVGHYNHFIMICLVKPFTNQEMFNKILQSANFIKKNQEVNKIEGAQIQMEKVYVELKCPLSFQRIKVPVKGRECVHDTCVDLQSLILLNKSAHRQWKCPICKKKSHQLVINEVLSKIIKQNGHLNLAGVTFFRDGTFSLVEQKSDDSDSEEFENKKAPIVINIQDDSDDVQVQPVPPRNIVRQQNIDELNQPIPLPITVGLQEQSSIVPDCWQMDSFHHDPGMAALAIGDNEYERYEEGKQMNEQFCDDKNKDKETGSPNIELVSPSRIEQIPQQQPSIEQELLISDINKSVQCQKQNIENNQRMQSKEVENKALTRGETKPNEHEQSEDSVVVLHIPKKMNITETRNDTVLANQSKSTLVVGQRQNVIEILDSDEETEEEKNVRYIQHQRYQLHQMLYQRNICPAKATASQQGILEGIAKKLLPLCK